MFHNLGLKLKIFRLFLRFLKNFIYRAQSKSRIPGYLLERFVIKINDAKWESLTCERQIWRSLIVPIILISDLDNLKIDTRREKKETPYIYAKAEVTLLFLLPRLLSFVRNLKVLQDVDMTF